MSSKEAELITRLKAVTAFVAEAVIYGGSEKQNDAAVLAQMAADMAAELEKIADC